MAAQRDLSSVKQELNELAHERLVILDPASQQGHWRAFADTDAQPCTRLHLDYGSGMGDYTVALAPLHPDTLFIGIEQELFCVANAAAKARDAAVTNAVFAAAPPADPNTAATCEADVLHALFAPGELDSISLCFPTPHARAHDAAQRMTCLDALFVYRDLLAPAGTLFFKTDSKPLWDFSLTQLALAGYRVSWQTDDLHAQRPSDPQTGYERKLAGQGARIYALEATPDRPGPARDEVQQTAALSLYDYLPQDLTSLDYIPTDMRRSVQNMIDAQARVAQAREARESRASR